MRSDGVRLIQDWHCPNLRTSTGTRLLEARVGDQFQREYGAGNCRPETTIDVKITVRGNWVNPSVNAVINNLIRQAKSVPPPVELTIRANQVGAVAQHMRGCLYRDWEDVQSLEQMLRDGQVRILGIPIRASSRPLRSFTSNVLMPHLKNHSRMNGTVASLSSRRFGSCPKSPATAAGKRNPRGFLCGHRR